jgi:hypothetical protein
VPDPEFVTIAEASLLLGVGERSARRAAARLSDSDRRVSDTLSDKKTNAPARVRLSALAAQMGKAIPAAGVSDTQRQLSDTMSDSVRQIDHTAGALEQPAGQVSDTLSDTPSARRGLSFTLEEIQEEVVATLRDRLAAVELRAAVAESERDGLQARLADTQEDRDAWKLQAQQALEAVRAAQDETRASRLIPAGRGGGLIEPQVSQNGPQGGESVPEAPMEPPTADTAQNGQKRGFWRRLVDSFSGGG